jgi:protease IV
MKPSVPTPPQSANKTFLYVLFGVLGFFFLGFVLILLVAQHLFGKSSNGSLLDGSDEITMIEINGPIYQSDDIIRRIKRFRKGSRKALILRLNSPGGAVAPSQEIYSEVLRARENKKIVVASMSSLAASGAYYIASACDKIVADPGTLTGSIGVIAEFPDASGLLKKVGLSLQTIKSGKFKDTGSFSRPMNLLEREYLQETINDVFQQFLGSVVDGRRAVFQQKLGLNLKKKPEQVTDQEIRNYLIPFADGRVLTGKRAYELGFIDKLGNYYDAVELTANLAGIKGEPSVRLDQPTKFDQLLNSILPFSYLAKSSSVFQLEYRVF